MESRVEGPQTQTASEHRTVALDFTPRDTEIDYFKLDPELILDPKLISEGELFPVSEERITLRSDEYLNLERHFHTLDHSACETVVLNIPVGCGKTSICYELVRKYYNEGYYVIVCSPFQKLVEKDYKELIRRYHFNDAQIYNYKQLAFDESTINGSLEGLFALNARVHVMTINCLLQNPGEEYYEQAFHKSRFLSLLRKKIEEKEKKVVFFFDEIHESVLNFSNEFLPYLMKWRHLVHKCYVASATFTPASIPVIRLISFLTLATIKIYYSPRVLKSIRANLHLHISDETYTINNHFKPLKELISLVDQYVEEGYKINILSGYKSLVEELTDRKNERIELVRKIRSLNPNICTSRTEKEFNAELNNIGTNFKTGVDINYRNAALIILLPTVDKSSSIKNYGIFTDGIPSIIQSMARLRQGGNIHVFMQAPDATINFDNIREHLPEELILENKMTEYHPVNHSYQKLQEDYTRKRHYLRHQIEFMNEIVEGIEDLKYHYPTFQDFLINRSATLSVKEYTWMGRGLSPYVLWAAINNQLCNARLTSICYYTKNIKQINLTSGNEQQELLELLTGEERLLLARKSLSEGLNLITRYIGTSNEVTTDANGVSQSHTYNNKFIYNGNSYTVDRLKNLASIKPVLIKILVFLKFRQLTDLSKEVYIRTCIANSQQYQQGEISELISIYQTFKRLKDQFITFIQSKAVEYRNEQIIHKDYYLELPESFVQGTIQLVQRLKQQDKLFQNNIFSFFQNHTKILTMEDIGNTKKKIAFEFEELFTNINRSNQSSRRTMNRQKNAYYAWGNELENSQYLSEVNFLGR